MRILHIIPSLGKGGAERLSMDICAQLCKREGITVALIVLRNVVEYTFNNVDYAVKVIPANVGLSPIKRNKLNVAGLTEFVNQFKPDIIHSHLFEAELVSRSIDYPAAKWFSHCHDNMRQLRPFGFDTLTNKQLLTEYYERSYLFNRYQKNGGNRFIAISKDTQKYFEAVLPERLRHVTLLHNAVDTKKFLCPAGYAKKRTADLQLVTVGSLVDKKNQVFLLEVMKRLKKKNYNAHLDILGDGPNREMLERKADELKISESVTFNGNVTNVQDFLWNSDIYLHAATYEPFGLVLVEAMTAGLPVVCLDGKGNRDIIQNQINGFMLKQADVKDYADKIGFLFHDKFRYGQVKEAGLATAAKFDIVSYTDKLLSLYRQALNG